MINRKSLFHQSSTQNIGLAISIFKAKIHGNIMIIIFYFIRWKFIEYV